MCRESWIKITIASRRITTPVDEILIVRLSFFECRQWTPHEKNINSAAGRANIPMCGPNHPQKSVIVENMTRAVATVFSL